MKGGMIVQIRVNPKDCLGILDCIEAAEIDPAGKSFASLTSLVLSSLIQLARESKIIKGEEDGFQYANRMAPYGAGKSTSSRKKFTQVLLRNAQLGISPPKLAQPSVSEATQPHLATKEVTIDMKGLMAELQGLMDKQDSGAELTGEETNRYEYLNKVLFS